MIHKAKDNDSDINVQVKQSGKPRIPLKLGLGRVTHAVERGHDDSTALWVLKSKHTHTLVPYENGDHAPVYGYECTSCDIMRSVCFPPRTMENKALGRAQKHPHDCCKLNLFELIYFAQWWDAEVKQYKHNNEIQQLKIYEMLYPKPPLAVCFTPLLYSPLHKTCCNTINSWTSLSLLANINK